MIILVNSFSPNMLKQQQTALEFTPMTIRQVDDLIDEYGFQSYLSQQNVLNVYQAFSSFKGEISINRKPYYLRMDDTVIQLQYVGPYFSDDSYELPENGKLFFWKIKPLEYKTSMKIDKMNVKTYAEHQP